MNELVAIEKTHINGAEVNSANSRDIYEYLEVDTKYNDWINRAIEKYGFEENIDYSKMSNGTSRGIDYIVTMDMAKELCMVSNTDKGKETRKYFIAMEEKAMKMLQTTGNPLLDALIETQRQTNALEKKFDDNQVKLDTKLLEVKEQITNEMVELVEKNNPVEINPPRGFFAVNHYMNRYGMSKQTIMKVIDAFDPRSTSCSKFVEKVGISEYLAYKLKDMDDAMRIIKKDSKKISDYYYKSDYINGRFQMNLF